MNIPPYARLASRLLAKAAPARVPAPADAVRADAIAAIQAAIVEKARRRTRVRAAGALGVAAVVLLVGMAALRSPAPIATRHEAAATRTGAGSVAVRAQPMGSGALIVGSGALAREGQELTLGSHVAALAEGHALLHFATGSEVTVEADSEVALLEAGTSQTVALARGALRAHVAKLAPGRRFLVRTSDAEIEVHGTSFRVEQVAADARCGSGTVTRVLVYEGVVSVRAGGIEQRIAAGERWPRDCAPETNAEAPAVVPAVPAASGIVPDAPVPAAKTDLRTRLARSAESTLRAQNEMFGRATAARRAGDLASAVRELEQLLAQYPRGPLAEDATAERMQWLALIDRAHAEDAARTYLALYPQGFARDRAEAILGAGE